MQWGSQCQPQSDVSLGEERGFWHAKVSFPGLPPIDCIVRDVSEGCALLELPVPSKVTTRLHLHIEEYGVDVECDVRHVSGHHVGVEFVGYSERERPVLCFGRRPQSPVGHSSDVGSSK